MLQVSSSIFFFSVLDAIFLSRGVFEIKTSRGQWDPGVLIIWALWCRVQCYPVSERFGLILVCVTGSLMSSGVRQNLGSAFAGKAILDKVLSGKLFLERRRTAPYRSDRIQPSPTFPQIHHEPTTGCKSPHISAKWSNSFSPTRFALSRASESEEAIKFNLILPQDDYWIVIAFDSGVVGGYERYQSTHTLVFNETIKRKEDHVKSHPEETNFTKPLTGYATHLLSRTKFPNGMNLQENHSQALREYNSN